MKRFLIQVTIFSLIIAGFLAAGEYAIRQMPNPYKYKHRWMQQNAGSVETLILGSSHTYYGINPAMLPGKAFSLANVSQDYKYDLLLLEQYADSCKSLRNVIIPVSYFSFFDPDLECSNEWYCAIYYKIYMGIDIHPALSKYNFELSHLSVYSGKIRNLLSFSYPDIDCDSLGFGNRFTLADRQQDWESHWAEIVNRHTAKDWNNVSTQTRRLTEILTFCQSRSVNVILITTPTWHKYYENLDPRQLQKMYDIVHDLQARYGVTYIDYLKDPRFTADDFHDCDHLSTDVGAIKFTRILCRDIFRDTIAR